MTLVRDRVVSLSSSGLVKMDERKRPAAPDHEDSAPPSKKQATSVNGAGKAHIDAEMPWRDDLEVSLTNLRNSQGAKLFCILPTSISACFVMLYADTFANP